MITPGPGRPVERCFAILVPFGVASLVDAQGNQINTAPTPRAISSRRPAPPLLAQPSRSRICRLVSSWLTRTNSRQQPPGFPCKSRVRASLQGHPRLIEWGESVLKVRPLRTYTAVVERCPDTNLYVGYVPGFPGAHSQGATLDELHANLQEVIGMLLDDGEPKLETEFVGTQTVVVD